MKELKSEDGYLLHIKDLTFLEKIPVISNPDKIKELKLIACYKCRLTGVEQFTELETLDISGPKQQ